MMQAECMLQKLCILTYEHACVFSLAFCSRLTSDEALQTVWFLGSAQMLCRGLLQISLQEKLFALGLTS